MLQSLLNIFKVPDLRRKLGFTVLLIMVYRIGAHVPCPFVDLEKVNAFANQSSQTGLGALFGMVDMFTGQAFKQMTIFALGIMPYITASIILQLLTVVWPYLEKIAKEGEAGRKKINQFTRYGTVMLAAFQSIGLGIMMIRMDMKLDGVATPLFLFSTMVAMTTGTCFIMWLGEKITEYGIGNGISIIIAVGIMASYYNSIQAMRVGVRTDSLANIWVVAIPVIYIGVTMLIILMQQASRRIPIQYARRMVGRREMQGGGNFLPLKLNTAGVIPVIFSSSILMFPGLLLSAFTGGAEERGMAVTLQQMFAPETDLYNLYALFGLDNWGGLFRIFEMGNLYNFLYVLLTVFFCYFYTAITFNPVDTADNLKRVGAFIPGRRPGKNTSDYIDYVLTRITVVGSTYLVVVALMPNLLAVSFDIDWNVAMLVGGTGLIIVAGVMLDLMKQIESQLLMRHYEGFKYRARGSVGSSRSGGASSGRTFGRSRG